MHSALSSSCHQPLYSGKKANVERFGKATGSCLGAAERRYLPLPCTRHGLPLMVVQPVMLRTLSSKESSSLSSQRVHLRSGTDGGAWPSSTSCLASSRGTCGTLGTLGVNDPRGPPSLGTASAQWQSPGCRECSGWWLGRSRLQAGQWRTSGTSCGNLHSVMTRVCFGLPRHMCDRHAGHL